MATPGDSIDNTRISNNRIDNEKNSWVIDGLGKLCRRVCDEISHAKLDSIVLAINGSGESQTTAGEDITVGTSPIDVPATAGNALRTMFIQCDPDQGNSRRLLVYMHGGSTNPIVLKPGDFFGWSVKGGLTQIKVEGNVADVLGRSVFNRKA